MSVKPQKKHHVWKKDYIWDTTTWNCENVKYVGSITDDSVTTCDEIIDTTKITLTKTFLLQQILYITSFFINYHSFINTC